MQLQRITSTTLITLLTAATTSFAPNFLALFPTSLALAQTPTDIKPEMPIGIDINDVDGLRRIGIPEDGIEQLQQMNRDFERGISEFERKREEEREEEQRQLLQQDIEQSIKIDHLYDLEAKADELLQEATQQLKTSQFQAALKSWHKALAIYYEIDSSGTLWQIRGKRGYGDLGNKYWRIYYTLGVVYNRLGQYPNALVFFQQALGNQIGDKARKGAALNGIGEVYNSLGRYSDALKSHQQALVIAKEVSDIAREWTALKGLGAVYYSLGQYAQALKFYQQALDIQALDIFKQIDEAGKATTLTSIGAVYNSLGQSTQSLKFFEQALVIHKQVGNKAGEATTLTSIGEVYARPGQYAQALKFFEQALVIHKQVGNKAGEATTLNNIGATYSSLRQYPQALNFFQPALDIRKQVGDKAGKATTLTSIGEVYNNLGRYLDAERTLIAAIAVLESMRPALTDADKVSIFETQADTYRLLQQALIAQKKTDKALEVAERSRARAFVELLAPRVSFDRTIQANIAPPTFEQIRQIAKTQRATLVEYSITYNTSKVQGKGKWYPELYIWVVKSTGEVAFCKVDLNVDTNLAAVAEEARIAAATGRNRAAEQQEAVLSNLVRDTRDSISQESSNTAANFAAAGEATSTPRSKNQHLQQLHELLIQPIADLLPTDPEGRVIFIPQGPLFLVPFPALQDASGKYLIEKHTILTAPAIKVLELNRQQWLRALGKDMLVVGNPTMPSIPQAIGEPPQKLAPLPGAEQEAIEISSLLNTKAITGSQATETAIKQQMPRAGIIHLATHGLLDDFTGGGVPGAIALAPSGKDNGLLTANEILDLKLNAELVVLSACDTGRGRITGDGVIGLSRSLISAGVPSVVVSLWKVPDEPTASLMREFYRQWQRHRNKAAALRQAMLTTMKQHPKPRDWAAFTLIGEAR